MGTVKRDKNQYKEKNLFGAEKKTSVTSGNMKGKKRPTQRCRHGENPKNNERG